MKTMLMVGASLITSLAMAQSATYSIQDLGLAGGSPGGQFFMTSNGLIAGPNCGLNNMPNTERLTAFVLPDGSGEGGVVIIIKI